MIANTYAIAGVVVESEIALPSLAPFARASHRDAPQTSEIDIGGSDPLRGPADLLLVRSDGPFADPITWLYHQADDGFLVSAVGRCAGAYVLSVPGSADFRFAEDGSEIAFALAPSASEALVEWIFLERALPLWLDLTGRRALHAGAVRIASPAGPRAVALLGRSGAGKSTLAAALCAEADAALLADDCAAISLREGDAIAHPSAAVVRLWPDAADALFGTARQRALDSPAPVHGTARQRALDSPAPVHACADGDKRRVAVRVATEATPLGAIALLDPSEGPLSATRLGPRDAIAALAPHLHRIDPGRPDRLGAELDFLEQIAATTPVVRLVRPRAFEESGAIATLLASIAAME